MMKYHLNFRNQYKTLSFTFFVWFSLSALVFFKFKSVNDNQGIFIAYIVAFLFSCGPSIFLYLTYLYHSVGKTIVINHFEQKIYVDTSKDNLIFDISEIERIVKVCSFPLAENRIQWMPSDSFFYIKLVMKNGKAIMITSLMADNDFNIYGSKIEVEKRLIPIIW